MKKKDDRLDGLRQQVDKVDDQLLRLLNERASVAKKIGEIKAKQNEQIYASNRESAILERLAASNPGPLTADSVEDIFYTVINHCRSLQKKLTISYFGPEATFTHQAAIKHFGKSAEYIPAKSIADVFDDVSKERADYGVVPIENSTEGVVNHTLDMFMGSDLLICAEREEPISQCLMASQEDLKKIRSLYSFPHALAQCRRWLEAHLPSVRIHDAASTADAAAQAALDATAAAIASPLAAEIYHLTILADRIEDSTNNATRFLIIGKKMADPSGKDKTSILFSIKDRIGALHDMLIPFKESGLNLTKIESRPTKKRAWEYVFFIDLLGHIADPKVKKAIEKLETNCVFLKVLGSYPRGD
ncbi:MAG TPA: prephenate dehydratase [Elusimicrobiota bacterium]|nr:prephenate dehydratase [Elusimicrobiota bacterium]